MRTILVGNNDNKNLIFPPCVCNHLNCNYPTLIHRDESLIEVFFKSANQRVSLHEFRQNKKKYIGQLIWLSDLPTLFIYATKDTYYTYWVVDLPQDKHVSIQIIPEIGEVLYTGEICE